MIVIDTGVKGSTKQAVEDVHRLCEDPEYLSHIEHIGSLVHEASESIENMTLIILQIYLINAKRLKTLNR